MVNQVFEGVCFLLRLTKSLRVCVFSTSKSDQHDMIEMLS